MYSVCKDKPLSAMHLVPMQHTPRTTIVSTSHDPYAKEEAEKEKRAY